MGDKSKIEWTSATWNPVAGCTRVSAGCDNCYAARLAAGRMKNTKSHGGLAVFTPSRRAAFNGKIRLLPDRLDQPLRWKKPRMIFVNSMSDLFHEGVPDEYIAAVFSVMYEAQQHVYQVLTKRPERMATLLATESFREAVEREWTARFWSPLAAEHGLSDDPPPVPRVLPNCWLGTSCEDQPAADERIPHLLRTPAAVRFLSCEPLLGPIDLAPMWVTCPRCNGSMSIPVPGGGAACPDCFKPYQGQRPGIHWVIPGGESGPGARPTDVAWIRSLVEQCRAAGVAAFVKQLGARPMAQEGVDFRYDDIPAAGFLGAMRVRTALGAATVGPLGELGIRDRKGGDIDEFPIDLRVREFPAPAGAEVETSSVGGAGGAQMATASDAPERCPKCGGPAHYEDDRMPEEAAQVLICERTDELATDCPGERRKGERRARLSPEREGCGCIEVLRKEAAMRKDRSWDHRVARRLEHAADFLEARAAKGER